MLGFLFSIIAFSLAAYALNRYLDARNLDTTLSRKALVMAVATVVSFGAGWLVDKLDGDAELPQSNVSFINALQSGDPVQLAKMLAGIK
jgi:hypothetical protein